MHPNRVAESNELLTRWIDRPCAPRYPLYTAYLQNLSAGERLNAVHRYLRPLVAELASQTHAVRFELVDAICRSIDFRGRVAGTSPVPGLPHELLEQIAVPTLLEQIRTQPDDAYAHLWLAMLPIRHSIPDLPERRELLDLAFRYAFGDEFVAERVADERLHSVQFACHHLPSSLLGSADSVLCELAELRQLASGLREERRKYYLAEADYCADAVEQYIQAPPRVDEVSSH